MGKEVLLIRYAYKVKEFIVLAFNKVFYLVLKLIADKLEN